MIVGVINMNAVGAFIICYRNVNENLSLGLTGGRLASAYDRAHIVCKS